MKLSVALMLTLRGLLAMAPTASVTVTVKLNGLPVAEEGVPLMPVPDKERPGGRVPVKLHA